MKIKQENFSTASKMSFTGLSASFYHVRVSAYDVQRLEGESGGYAIFYRTPTTQAR